MSDRELSLGWDRPFMPDAATHVSLFDGGTGPLYVVASGHGADDASALRDLWMALIERNESREAIAFVEEEYRALTGKSLARRNA